MPAKTKKLTKAEIRALADEMESRQNDPYRTITVPMAKPIFGDSAERVIQIIDDFRVPYVPKASGPKVTREFLIKHYAEAKEKWFLKNGKRA